ncbi:hypothetical protein FQN55_005714 [Onygenales sp. PD_40]|nr:hypothetical protein FQN55_005714 [Onygenales sp. PD_40]KAK2771410.1 hypothetical protein FQN52_005501 [Onygenales sp. PD_12]
MENKSDCPCEPSSTNKPSTPYVRRYGIITESPKRPPSSLLDLPSEIHLQIISWLNFRDLQMLRATSHYLRNLPSDAEIARIRRAFVASLVREEKEEATNSALHQTAPDDEEDDEALSHQRLTCYSCLRCLPHYAFSSTQTTRRRGKGHADAAKRFCASCALRLHKWEPGITLSFPWGEAVYCRRCHGLKNSRPGATEWAKIFGLCESCRTLLGIPDWHLHGEGEGAQGFWYGAKELIDRTVAERRGARERERGLGRGKGEEQEGGDEDVWEELKEKIKELRLSGELEE